VVLWVERALVGVNEKDGGEENLTPALSKGRGRLQIIKVVQV